MDISDLMDWRTYLIWWTDGNAWIDGQTDIPDLMDRWTCLIWWTHSAWFDTDLIISLKHSPEWYIDASFLYVYLLGDYNDVNDGNDDVSDDDGDNDADVSDGDYNDCDIKDEFLMFLFVLSLPWQPFVHDFPKRWLMIIVRMMVMMMMMMMMMTVMTTMALIRMTIKGEDQVRRHEISRSPARLCPPRQKHYVPTHGPTDGPTDVPMY